MLAKTEDGHQVNAPHRYGWNHGRIRYSVCEGCSPYPYYDAKSGIWKGGAIFERTDDEDGNRAWKCRNCGHTEPARKVSRPERYTEMTPSQERLVDRITKANSEYYNVKSELHERWGYVLLTLRGRGAIPWKSVTIGRRGGLKVSMGDSETFKGRRAASLLNIR